MFVQIYTSLSGSTGLLPLCEVRAIPPAWAPKLDKVFRITPPSSLFAPFIGSGSTLIAAEKTGRRCRGVELDPLYVDVILRAGTRQ